MTRFDDAARSTLAGRTVHGPNSEELGKVVDIYESADGSGTFVTVSTGMLSGAAFVPLEHATMDGECVVVPYGPDLIADAPRVGSGGELSAEEEDRLYRLYEVSPPVPTDPQDAGRARLRRCAEGPGNPVLGNQRTNKAAADLT